MMNKPLMRQAEAFDQFELKIDIKASDTSNQPNYVLTQAVFINGENLAPKYPIDLRELVKSCQLSGEFFIVTCGCGVPECAGIEDGIRVSHLPDRILWDVPIPISYEGMTDEEAEWQAQNRAYKKYIFYPDDFLTHVRNSLLQAKAKLFGNVEQTIECSPWGFEPED